MPRFRGGQGGADSLVIPHFAQQNHVGRLPQRRPKSADIAFGIVGNFPLADHAFFVPVQIFNRVLQRDDMAVSGAVDQVDHTGQGGGFAAARRSGDQHKPLFQLR